MHIWHKFMLMAQYLLFKLKNIKGFHKPLDVPTGPYSSPHIFHFCILHYKYRHHQNQLNNSLHFHQLQDGVHLPLLGRYNVAAEWVDNLCKSHDKAGREKPIIYKIYSAFISSTQCI